MVTARPPGRAGCGRAPGSATSRRPTAPPHGRRVDIEADDVLELGHELGIVQSSKRRTRCGARPCAFQMRCTRRHADAGRIGHGGPTRNHIRANGSLNQAASCQGVHIGRSFATLAPNKESHPTHSTKNFPDRLLGRGISCRRNLPVGFIHLPASIARTAHGCGQRQHNARNSIRTRGSFKATEASLTADQADSMPVSPSSPCSGIHNRLHGPLHRLVVDRIDVGELVRDRLQELRALAPSQRGDNQDESSVNQDEKGEMGGTRS